MRASAFFSAMPTKDLSSYIQIGVEHLHPPGFRGSHSAHLASFNVTSFYICSAKFAFTPDECHGVAVSILTSDSFWHSPHELASHCDGIEGEGEDLGLGSGLGLGLGLG